MRADTRYLSVIQNNNLICLTDCGRPLGYQKNSRSLLSLPERPAEPCICGEIKGRSAVIQNQNLRIPYKGPGNRKSLSLAAGQVPASLQNFFVKTLLFLLHNLQSLGRLKRLQKLFI